MNIAVVTDRARKRLKGKHPWIFSNEIEQKPPASVSGGAVEVRDRQGRFLATGDFNPHTLIAVRILSFQNLPVDIAGRVREACEHRRQHYPHSCCRLIYSESDRLPGLIVDRYDRTLVAQILTAGMELRRQELVDALVETVHPDRILLRNDSSYRALESLPLKVEWAFGESLPEQILEMDGLKLLVRYVDGQKTGFFLDQQENRRQISRYVRGGRMLDVFSYTGAWAMYAGKAGMECIRVQDSSREALRVAEHNAAMNGLRIEAVEGDAFEFLRGLYASPERYDLIVVDPPAFCKSKRHLEQALRGYHEINLRAMKLLARNGILVTSSCSQPVSPDHFVAMLQSAAADSGRTFVLRDLRLQPPDHPVLLQFPESLYLKCAFLQVL